MHVTPTPTYLARIADIEAARTLVETDLTHTIDQARHGQRIDRHRAEMLLSQLALLNKWLHDWTRWLYDHQLKTVTPDPNDNTLDNPDNHGHSRAGRDPAPAETR